MALILRECVQDYSPIARKRKKNSIDQTPLLYIKSNSQVIIIISYRPSAGSYVWLKVFLQVLVFTSGSLLALTQDVLHGRSRWPHCHSLQAASLHLCRLHPVLYVCSFRVQCSDRNYSGQSSVSSIQLYSAATLLGDIQPATLLSI